MGRASSVVDDEEHITELVAMGLGYNGFDVVRLSSGRAALDAIDKQRPDLVVLDVNLPDLDGFEVCRRLRAEGRRVPIVYLTARDDPADLRAGFTGGGDDYIRYRRRPHECGFACSLRS